LDGVEGREGVCVGVLVGQRCDPRARRELPLINGDAERIVLARGNSFEKRAVLYFGLLGLLDLPEDSHLDGELGRH
jgi:hypothetical protein